MADQHPIPIAIIGMGCRFPGGANGPEKLWEMLLAGRSAWSPVPSDRWNSESFYHPNIHARDANNHRGGHFLDGNISAFDASFFGIQPSEASVVDPQQRILLEAAYEALENAGIRLEDIRGSDAAVFVASFVRDYEMNIFKDTQGIPPYTMTGTGSAIIANRISYLFDLRGASIALDTGCSGSLVALHQACQNLRARESSLAFVGGTNLLLGPDVMQAMSLSRVLNDDGKCYTFDNRGAGYGRGEGVATIVRTLLAYVYGGNIFRLWYFFEQGNADFKLTRF
jgi:acyl transferase domain-containing protein